MIAKRQLKLFGRQPVRARRAEALDAGCCLHRTAQPVAERRTLGGPPARVKRSRKAGFSSDARRGVRLGAVSTPTPDGRLARGPSVDQDGHGARLSRPWNVRPAAHRRLIDPGGCPVTAAQRQAGRWRRRHDRMARLRRRDAQRGERRAWTLPIDDHRVFDRNVRSLSRQQRHRRHHGEVPIVVVEDRPPGAVGDPNWTV